MSDKQERWWDAHKPNATIIGISEGPWTAGSGFIYPTEGYDADLVCYRYGDVTKEQWLELADHMIQRWTDWKAFISTLKEK